MTTLALAYLAAWAFAVSIALGGLGVLALGRVTGARWLAGPDSPYAAEAARLARALPILGALFVPIALAARYLYAWTAAPTGYLNLPFWIARAIAAFVIWTLLARAVARGSTRAAAAALPVVGITSMFAAIDWIASLAAPWSSTVFGLAFLLGGATAALALIAVRGRARATSAQAGALGRLLLALLCTWTYLALSQAFVIWIADVPSEVPWYLARTRGPWGIAFAVLLLGGFVVPFFALLPAAPKRRPRVLAAIGAWLVVMHALDLAWQVLP